MKITDDASPDVGLVYRSRIDARGRSPSAS
jgi:hypothetical protein